MDDLTAKIARNIKAARIKSGLDTQEAAAIFLDIKIATYRRYENDQIPSTRRILQLAEAFGVTPNDLLI